MSKAILSDLLVLSRVSHRAARLKLCLHWETFAFSEPGLSTRGDALSSMAINYKRLMTNTGFPNRKIESRVNISDENPHSYKSPHLILLMS